MTINGTDDFIKKCVLLDVNQIGKHYFIKSTCHKKSITDKQAAKPGSFDSTRHGTKRQYTECFAMRNDVYENLLKLARSPFESHVEAACIRDAITKNSRDNICLTIKNY